MLPKRARLTKRTIEEHLIKARRLRTSRFLVLYARIPGAKAPQVSFTVSKKIAPKAVLRNKLRRRGYAAVRALIPSLSTESAILVSYLSPDTRVSLSEIAKELESAFQKSGLLKR